MTIKIMCLILFLSSQMAILTTTLCLFYKSVCCLQFCKLWILPVTSTPEKCQRHHTSVRTESMQFKLTWESTVITVWHWKTIFGTTCAKPVLVWTTVSPLHLLWNNFTRFFCSTFALDSGVWAFACSILHILLWSHKDRLTWPLFLMRHPGK